VDTVKICFTIKDKKEKFSFKDHILYSPAHPQKAYLPEETIAVTKKKKNRGRRKNKTSQSPEETINMINTIQSTTNSSLHHSLLRRMTLAYRRSSVPSVRRSSTRPSAMLDQVST
jgi:hypothetical protein